MLGSGLLSFDGSGGMNSCDKSCGGMFRNGDEVFFTNGF